MHVLIQCLFHLYLAAAESGEDLLEVTLVGMAFISRLADNEEEGLMKVVAKTAVDNNTTYSRQ
jgi:hypothetical protein